MTKSAPASASAGRGGPRSTASAPSASAVQRGHPLRGREPVRVDVVEHDLGVAQRRERQDVAEQVAGELDAAGADEHDPGHRTASSLAPAPRMWRRPWLWYRSIQSGRSGLCAAQPGEREGEERDRRHGGQRRVVLGRPAGSGSRIDDATSGSGPTSIVRAPQSRAWRRRSATAARRRAVRREGDDDGVRPEHRRGAGGHLPDLGALGVDERHLLELERRLERGRVGEPAARDEQVAGVDEGRGDGLDERVRGRDRGLGGVGGGEDRLDLAARAAARAEQLEQQQLGRDERRREGLGHDRDDRTGRRPT